MKSVKHLNIDKIFWVCVVGPLEHLIVVPKCCRGLNQFYALLRWFRYISFFPSRNISMTYIKTDITVMISWLEESLYFQIQYKFLMLILQYVKQTLSSLRYRTFQRHWKFKEPLMYKSLFRKFSLFSFLWRIFNAHITVVPKCFLSLFSLLFVRDKNLFIFWHNISLLGICFSYGN